MNILRNIILMSVALISLEAITFATPVVNESAQGEGVLDVTILPDNVDPNLYYYAPTVVLVSKDEKGIPTFFYQEYLSSFWNVRRALIQTTLKPDSSQSKFNEAFERVKKVNPKAHFVTLPILNSRIEFDKTSRHFVNEVSCSHIAGFFDDEISCNFVLNSDGIKAFRSHLTKAMTFSLQFLYEYDAVIKTAEGKYKDRQGELNIAVRIGSQELLKYPELFQDENGDQLVISHNAALGSQSVVPDNSTNHINIRVKKTIRPLNPPRKRN